MKKIVSSIEQAVLVRAVEQSPASIVITDIHGAIQYVNPKFESITGYSFQEALGKNPRLLKSGLQSQDFYKSMWDTIMRGQVWDGIFHNMRKDGSFFWEHCVIAPVVDDSGTVTHFVAIKEDITEKKEQEEELRRSEEELRKRNAIISKDLEYARFVQNSLINTPVPEIPGLTICTRFIPYDYVSGDFFTIKLIHDGLCVFLADVTGHGVPAALFSSVLKYAVENLWNNGLTQPEEFLPRLNDELIDVFAGHYFTAFYSVITPADAGTFDMKFSRCGQPYPILLSNDTITILDAAGMILGLHKNITISSSEITLNRGDRLFLYTDGLAEIEMDDIKDLRFDIISDIVMQTKTMPLDDAVSSMLQDIREKNKNIDDDIAMIAIEVG